MKGFVVMKEFFEKQISYLKRRNVDVRPLHTFLNKLQKKTQPLRLEILNHKLFKSIQTPQQANWVLENISFTLWTQTAFLKKIQNKLSNKHYMWTPKENSQIQHFITQMLFKSESIKDRRQGVYTSYLGLYIDAMKQSKANTEGIQTFLNMIREGFQFEDFIRSNKIPSPARNFLSSTQFFLSNRDLIPTIVWSSLGQHDIISIVHPLLLKTIKEEWKEQFDLWVYLMNKQLSMFSKIHIPMSLHLLMYTWANQQDKKDEITDYASETFEIWIEFMDDILHKVIHKEDQFEANENLNC